MRAINVAAKVHEGQKRKSTELPFIVHPFAVMLIVSEVTGDEDTLIAALLHDVIEDVDPGVYSEHEMRTDFGNRVADIVRTVSKDATLSIWQAQCDAYIEQMRTTNISEALVVCAADKVHNLSAILEDLDVYGEMTWQRFNADKERQLWWYDTTLAILQQRLPDNQLTKRLADLVDQLHHITRLKPATV